MVAQNYRDKLVYKSEIGTPAHDEMCFSIDKPKVFEFLEASKINVDKFRKPIQKEFSPQNILCDACKKEHVVRSKYGDAQKYILRIYPSQEEMICVEEINTDNIPKTCSDGFSKSFWKFHEADIKELQENAQKKLELDVVIEFEHICLSYSKYPMAIIDLIASISHEDLNKEIHLLIEVKPNVASFGDVLRQIRVYQKYYPSNNEREVISILYYKRCENKKILEVLNEQGIITIQCKEPMQAIL